MTGRVVRRRWACAYESGERPVETLLPPAVPAWVPDGLLAHPVTAYCAALTDAPVMALTYDDGPDPRHTPGVLDALRDGGTTATFFVLLDQARRHPELVTRILAEGHEVGLHGADHHRVSTRPVSDFARGLRSAVAELRGLTGTPVSWYRPAYGAIRIDQQVVVHSLGLDVPVWTAWARDWEDADVAELTHRAVAALHRGGVLLLHDAASGLPADAGGRTVEPTFDRGELTRRLLAAAGERGYRFARLSELATTYPQARVPWFESRAAGLDHAARAGETTRPTPG